MDIEASQNKIRNRRYKKLVKLREQGFFDEEAIMLRHPVLYFTYVGKYKNNNGKVFNNAQQFFQSQLLNSEYRKLLLQQNKIKFANMMEEKVQQQDEKEIELKDIHQNQLQLHQENLIDHVEELFLSGQQKDINYGHIDNSSQLDDQEIQDRDEEEKYFNHFEDDHDFRDPSNNTGLQDF